MIEPSTCGGDAALRQITLTACLPGPPTFRMLSPTIFVHMDWLEELWHSVTWLLAAEGN